MPKTKLKELGILDPKASLGHFIACVMIDSCVYQIGDEIPDLLIAFQYCEEFSNEMQPVQIFNDKGEAQIINGKLKEVQA